ncbi:hypothetical protein TNCV_973881 [Trichonephila clavipes]|nr:hypothetical protein TNCV_973881 [Trichonephila clavipes]
MLANQNFWGVKEVCLFKQSVWKATRIIVFFSFMRKRKRSPDQPQVGGSGSQETVRTSSRRDDGVCGAVPPMLIGGDTSGNSYGEFRNS